MKKNLFNLQNTKNIYKQFVLLFILFLSGNFWAQTNPTPFDLSTGSWTFMGWNASIGSGKYPTNAATGTDTTTGVSTSAATSNMMFYKNGSTDPSVSSVPTADYAGTYTSGTAKMYGNGSNGVVFDNTGGVGYGSALLSINTINRTNIQVAWTGRTITAGARTYGIRLMYRIGTSGAFTDASSTAAEIFYPAATSAGSTNMSVITLPTAVNNQTVVQLMWLNYNASGTTSGTRPVLGLDDITVSSSSSGITSAQSGNWSSPSTWVGGVVPTSSSNAVIASGHTVTMDNATYATRSSGTTTTVNGTLATNLTYVNSGTTTINGTFQLDNGGYASGTALAYAATGSSLVFNSGSLYSVGLGNAFWPTSNSPFNVTINSGSGAQLNTAVGAVAGTLTLNGQLDAVNAVTVNGNLQLNSGGYVSSNAPVYGTTSTLLYNTTYGVGTEWTTTGTTAGSGIPNNVTIQNNAAVTYPSGAARGMAGNLNIISGSLTSGDILNVKGTVTNVGSLITNSTFNVTGATSNSGTLTTNSTANFTGAITNTGTFNSNGTSNLTSNFTNSGSTSALNLNGDFYLAGNWANAGNFTPNNRGVFFNAATGTQTITNTNSTNSNTETFAYLINNKAAGVLQLNSNVVINGTVGNVLQLNSASNLDLNAKTLTLSGDNGNILASGGVRNIISSVTGGVLNISGNKVVTSASNGSLVLGTSTNPSYLTTILNKGLDFGAGNLTTVNGVLQINANGYANVNAPKYANNSTLVYNAVNPYTVNIEWIGNSNTAGIGIPQNVTLNSSNITMPAGARGLAGILTINSGSTINLEGTIGSDLSIGGNLVNNGTLNANSRAVIFNGTAAQTITGATTFDYLTLNNSTGLTLSGASSSIIVNQTLALTSGKITLGANNLTIGASGSISGNAPSNYIVTAGAGQLKRTVGSGAIVFPVGSASAYNPITLTNAGTSDVYGVILTSGTVPNVPDATSTVNDRWLVSEATAGGSNLTVVPQWNTADQGTNFATATQAYVGFYDGTSWTQNAATVSGSNPYTATGASAFTPSALSGTQYFAVGKDNAFICSASSITYSQGFNSTTIPGCWSTTIIPNGTFTSTLTQGGTKISFVASSTNPNPGLQEGTHFIMYGAYSNTNGGKGSEERLNSAPLSSVGVGSVDVDFYMHHSNDSTFGTLATEGVQLQYSLDGITWFDVSGAYFARYSATTGWKKETVTLPASCANVSKFYVGFKFHSEYQYNIYLDNVVVKQSPPTLFVNGTSSATLSFGTNGIGTTVTPQTFSLSGANLTGAPSNITLTAPADFQISSDGGATWSNSTTVAYTTSTLSAQDISVKYIPSTCGSISSGNITLSGGGVATYPTVSVSGTATLAKPVANTTDITATTFTANWGVVNGATGYELDVYTMTQTAKTLFENFETGLPSSYTTGSATLSTGTWNGARFIKGSTQPNSGTSVLQLESSSNSYLQTPALENISSISFWMAGSNAAASMKVQYSYDDVNWLPVESAMPTYYGTTTKQLFTINLATPLSGLAKIRLLRFGAALYIDDVKIDYTETTYTYQPTYNPKIISGGSTTSQIVTGLTPNTQYYYRVRATNGSCQSTNSDAQAVLTNNTIIWDNNVWTNTTGPDTTLDAIVRTPYYVKANADEFAVHNLTIENTGLLKIKSGQGITVSGDITTPDDKIIIESDASLTQTKIANGNSSNKAIAKRNVKMKTLDYTYWSSPLKDQVLLNTSNVNATNSSGGFSPGTPNNRTYEYNEVADNFKATANATFTPAKGYAIRGKSGYGTTLTVDSLAFSGNLHNGDYSIQIQKSQNTISNSVTYEHGYNLIGNPYPSNINFINLYNLDHGDGVKNSDVIYGKAWFWTNFSASGTQAGSSYAGNNYATITLAGGTAPTSVDSAEGTPVPNEFIKVAQGFIVQMKGNPPTGTIPNTGTIKFDNSIRTNNTTGHFYNNNKNTNDDINRYWLKIVSPFNITNTILIAHMDGATNQYDADYDAELLTVGDDSFYSKINAQKLQIQARNNPLNVDDAIALGTKYAMNGTYKISLGNREGIFAKDQKIYLRDKLTEVYTDLTAQDYSFDVSKGTDDRFEIVYKNKEVLGVDNLTKSDFFVYKDGDYFVVKSSNALGKIELYDVTGKLVQSKNTLNKEVKFDVSAMVSGVYIIKAGNSGNIRTKKIIK